MTFGIKEHTEGGVTAAFYSYRSLHTDIVRDAMEKAVPESSTWENQALIAGFNWFLEVVPSLREMRFSGDLTEDESILREWWENYEAHMRSGEWRAVWEGYTALSYETQLMLVAAYKATRRQVIGASEGLAGDSKDPKLSKPVQDSEIG